MTSSLRTNSLFLDSDDEGDVSSTEDIIVRCALLKQHATHAEEIQERRRTPEYSDLFGVAGEEAEGNIAVPFSQEEVRLQRLLGDPMLSSQGDKIMALMEATANNDPGDDEVCIPSKSPRFEALKEDDASSQSSEDEPNLATLLESLNQLERYLDDNQT